MQEILEHVHAIRLQTMYEMGSVRELDRTLAQALMAEFTRMQLLIGQDLTKSLIALSNGPGDLQSGASVGCCQDPQSAPHQSGFTPIEGHPSRVPTGHFFESESASDGAAGGSGGPGGFPPVTPSGDKLPCRDPGTGGRTCQEDVGQHQQGT